MGVYRLYFTFVLFHKKQIQTFTYVCMYGCVRACVYTFIIGKIKCLDPIGFVTILFSYERHVIFLFFIFLLIFFFILFYRYRQYTSNLMLLHITKSFLCTLHIVHRCYSLIIDNSVVSNRCLHLQNTLWTI